MEFAAFSKEWIAIAEPIIQRYRETGSRIDKETFFKTDWPSEYACENLIEALAEYVMCYANGQYFESRIQFEKTVAPLIIKPTSKILKCKLLIARAKAATKANNIVISKQYYEQALSLFPDKPRIHFHLAGIAANSQNYADTLHHCQKMLESFDLIHSEESFKRDAILLILRTYIHTRQYLDAKRFADWLLIRFPNDHELSNYKAYCHHQLLESH